MYLSNNTIYPFFDERVSTAPVYGNWETLLGTALANYLSVMPRPLKDMGVSWHYFYESADGVNTVESYNGLDNKCLLLNKGYYLYTRFEDSNNQLSQTDGGVNSILYEVINGDYQIISGPCP